MHKFPSLIFCRYSVSKFLFWMFAELLEKIVNRLCDLHQIVKQNYYHPKMLGSWSIKAVLPCIAPKMSYSELEGINEGMGASDGFVEAIGIGPEGLPTMVRKLELEDQLLRYCRFDTEAMVEIVRFFRNPRGVES